MISLETIFSQITRHSRYLGNEVNSTHKDLDRMAVKFLLAFPDVYEIGMSHLGFQILYHILNRQEDVGAERVFAPWVDMEKELRERDLPLFSLESRRPLSFFDIIGFSLQYELSYTNVLSMLNLGKIPLRSQHRNEKSPLVIAGGPCTFNPEPMAEFFDALVIGEGEEVILEIVDVFKAWRKKKEERTRLLERLNTISGVYVPSGFAVTYHQNGSIKEFKPLMSGQDKIKKRIISDLDGSYYPTKFIVPFMQIVHDHLNLEIARGCTRGCRFCQAGIIYRPVRERSRPVVEKIAEETLKSTGWEELSVLSLSSGDYTGIAALLEGLIKKYSRQNISISFPSLRAETINTQWLKALEGGRKTGFTIAPEAGTERLRQVINKCLTEAEILETCQKVFSAGWKSIKLYFMIGLPTETQEDLEGIVYLAKKIFYLGKGAIQRPEVTVSVSTFIPKPHTPFQWLSMIDAEEIKFRQRYLRSLLKKSRIAFKWQGPEMSILEGLIARGDRRLAPVIEEAFRNGARFDGWTELFNFPVWEKAFQKGSLSPDSYLSTKDETDFFPWDHIETGVTRDFLWQELRNAQKGNETSDCRREACNHCGVCDFHSLYPRIQSSCDAKSQNHIFEPEKKTDEKVKKVRLQFSKTNDARFLSHLETARAFDRAARRASLPLWYSQGFHPQPRISFGPALPVGLESLDELVDIELKGDISIETVITSLNQQLPLGILILAGKEISLQTPAISDSVNEISYAISIGSSAIVARYSSEGIKRIFSEFLGKTSFIVSKTHKGEPRLIDIRYAVKELIFSDAKTISLTLFSRYAQGLKPREIIGIIFGIAEEDLQAISIRKIRMKLRE